MNWRYVYASLETWFVICVASACNAGFLSFLVASICGMDIGFNDSESLVVIGLPLFIILFVIFARFLPESLRKAGMLGDKPERFVPWLKQ